VTEHQQIKPNIQKEKHLLIVTSVCHKNRWGMVYMEAFDVISLNTSDLDAYGTFSYRL
jgi:hypothetical protein